MAFVCPVCARPLCLEGRVYRCVGGHAFDLAAAGYVNLFLTQTSSAKRHGDDKRMIRARKEFLDTGAYACLSGPLVEKSLALLPEKGTFLDAGCGEGHYTAILADKLAESQKEATLLGVDLSKEAVICAAKRKRKIAFAVASVYHLPLADESVDLVWNIFSPLAEEEYLRVLKKGGHLLRAYPLEEHLMGLKEQVYEQVYENKPEEKALAGLRLMETTEIRSALQLEGNEQIMALFSMTPYYYKTSASDQQKLAGLQRLNTPIAFGLSLYRKEG